MGSQNDEREEIDQTKYYEKLAGLDKEKNPYAGALETALDIRKFEIDLYWKRATYFWTLIGAIFVGHFAILNSDKIENKDFYAYMTACTGVVFTFAWFLANRGSKYWIENWENHVDMLEDKVSGELYKIVLSRSKHPNLSDALITGPLPVSVSKINQWVGLFTIFIWIVLADRCLPTFDRTASISWPRIWISSATLLFVMFIYKGSKSYNRDQVHIARRRESKIKTSKEIEEEQAK